MIMKENTEILCSLQTPT